MRCQLARRSNDSGRPAAASTRTCPSAARRRSARTGSRARTTVSTNTTTPSRAPTTGPSTWSHAVLHGTDPRTAHQVRRASRIRRGCVDRGADVVPDLVAQLGRGRDPALETPADRVLDETVAVCLGYALVGQEPVQNLRAVPVPGVAGTGLLDDLGDQHGDGPLPRG